MPKRVDKTQTEYSGTVPTQNTVQELGPNSRKLSPSEKLRLGYLTGQEDDPEANRKSGFFYGVDPDYPDIKPKGVG